MQATYSSINDFASEIVQKIKRQARRSSIAIIKSPITKRKNMKQKLQEFRVKLMKKLNLHVMQKCGQFL